MFVLLAAWLYLACVTLPLGLALMRFLGVPSGFATYSSNPAESLTVVALWLGLLGQAVFVQILAIAFPLYPWGIVAAAAIAIFAGFLCRGYLVAVLNAGRNSSPWCLAAILVLALSSAFVASGVVTYYDAGLYHIQFVQWLARDGLVHGLGLLHLRLGIPSPWFALAAIFEGGPLQGRMTATLGGYVVLLLVGQASFACYRLLMRNARRGDAVIAVAYGSLLLYSIWINVPLSSSPDLPVAATIVVLGWFISTSSSLPQNADLAITTILGGFTFVLKLSSAPIFAVVLIRALWLARDDLRTLFRPALLGIVIVLSNMYASLVLSGCPLFPSAVGCTTLPWSVSVVEAQRYQQSVLQSLLWGGRPPTGEPWGWVVPFFISPGNRTTPALILLPVILLVGSIIIPHLRRRMFMDQGKWILAMAIADFLFVIMLAPDPRFAIGAISLIFAQITTSALPQNSVGSSSDFSRVFSATRLMATVMCIGVLFFAVEEAMEQVNSRRWSNQPYGKVLDSPVHIPWITRVVLPPALPVIYGKTRQRNGDLISVSPAMSEDVRYSIPPIADQCWGAPVPCTPALTAPVRLLEPAKGPDGGFRRASP
jgi:hypothetical protein